MDANDRLYVTGPTLSMRDPLYRVTGRGRVEVMLPGFARPQGMVVLPDGDLLIAAAYGGKKGIFRLNPETRSDFGKALKSRSKRGSGTTLYKGLSIIKRSD
jgi:sugar lactone lactonase YvrE